MDSYYGLSSDRRIMADIAADGRYGSANFVVAPVSRYVEMQRAP